MIVTASGLTALRRDRRLTASLKVQEAIETALAVLEADRREGVAERVLAAAVGMWRDEEAFRDAMRGLAAQRAIERSPGGGWRLRRAR
jgi:hypothetical protein